MQYYTQYIRVFARGSCWPRNREHHKAAQKSFLLRRPQHFGWWGGVVENTLPLFKTRFTSNNICGASANISDVCEYVLMHHINLHIIPIKKTFLFPKYNKCNYKKELHWWFLVNTLFTPQPFCLCVVTFLIIWIVINSVSQHNWLLAGILSSAQTQSHQYILFSLF